MVRPYALLIVSDRRYPSGTLRLQRELPNIALRFFTFLPERVKSESPTQIMVGNKLSHGFSPDIFQSIEKPKSFRWSPAPHHQGSNPILRGRDQFENLKQREVEPKYFAVDIKYVWWLWHAMTMLPWTTKFSTWNNHGKIIYDVSKAYISFSRERLSAGFFQ